MNFNKFKKYISKSNYLDESSWDEFDGIDEEDDFEEQEINESSLDDYADRLTNYGMNCYAGIEQDVLKIFAKHGISFNSHRYGYTSEYTCPGAILKFDSSSYQFRTGRADFDKKAKLILNDIKYLLPKYKSFYWNGKTISGNARNGEVRTAQI